MVDKEQVIKEYERFVNNYICACTSDDYEYEMHKAVLELLKEQNDKPVLDDFGRCFLNALKRQLDMKLTMIEMLITPEFAEKIVELIETVFD